MNISVDACFEKMENKLISRPMDYAKPQKSHFENIFSPLYITFALVLDSLLVKIKSTNYRLLPEVRIYFLTTPQLIWGHFL
jgi:hypothetical protein